MRPAKTWRDEVTTKLQFNKKNLSTQTLFFGKMVEFWEHDGVLWSRKLQLRLCFSFSVIGNWYDLNLQIFLICSSSYKDWGHLFHLYLSSIANSSMKSYIFFMNSFYKHWGRLLADFSYIFFFCFVWVSYCRVCF